VGGPGRRQAGAQPVGASDQKNPAVLIYDGDCSMCRASALWLMRLALTSGELEILPCRSAPRHIRFPHLTDEACMTAMQLVLPDGRTLAGADAVPELLRRIHGLGWLATVFALPGARPIARHAYAWIAKNRMRLSCER
jgi:predicted DCC family thiol-disulfide oxidoreductase YuxK